MTILRAIYFGNPNLNTQIYTNFHNFFKLFENFCHFLVLSALGVNKSPLGFDNRLLHRF